MWVIIRADRNTNRDILWIQHNVLLRLLALSTKQWWSSAVVPLFARCCCSGGSRGRAGSRFVLHKTLWSQFVKVSLCEWMLKGDGRKRAHGKRSPPPLCSALLAPFACKTYCDSVSQSVKLLRLPLDSGGCNAADPFPFFFVLRVWARTSVSASSSTIPCCWSWPSRTWCSTTRCEAAARGSLGSRPWGGGLSVIISTLLHRIQSESTRTQVSLHHECIS